MGFSGPKALHELENFQLPVHYEEFYLMPSQVEEGFHQVDAANQRVRYPYLYDP